MKIKNHINTAPPEIRGQLSQVSHIIGRHLTPAPLAIHLYGSAMDGGLKPYSDIDVLVTVDKRIDEDVRRALLLDLLEFSAPPGQSEALRALELTVVVHSDVVPWRYPAMRELQFGEWLRDDILAGIFPPAVLDEDLAILLTQVRQKSIALKGATAESLFDPVPERDLRRALSATVKLWNQPQDWVGDERNVVLTLARVWYSVATGKIAPKDIAADWLIERLPLKHRPVLFEARQSYLGHAEHQLVSRPDQVSAFILLVKREMDEMFSLAPDDV